MTIMHQLFLATGMVTLTVIVHLTGLALLLALLRRHRANAWKSRMIADMIAVVSAAFGLFVLHTIEIWTWAIAYHLLGLLRGWEEAIYFSTTTYVTIGYGDVVLGREGRLLGAIEGANGIILLGWSTAFFFNIVDRLKLLERQIEKHEQDRR
jgi:voltage-gated potassium channel Kch